MRHERGWTSVAIWLALLGLALGCGAIVIQAAFDASVLAAGDTTLHISADYGADPRVSRVQEIAPVEWAVVGDTLHDLVLEQLPVPRPDLLTAPNAALPTARPTSVILVKSAPSTTPTAIQDLASLDPEDLLPATMTPTPAPLVSTPGTQDSTGEHRAPTRPTVAPAATSIVQIGSTALPAPPTRTSVPPSVTPLPPEATPIPLTATPIPLATPLVPPTATPIAPTETPLPTDTAIPPTETPLPPTDTAIPPTETPLPTDTAIPPTEAPLPQSDTPVPTALPTESLTLP